MKHTIKAQGDIPKFRSSHVNDSAFGEAFPVSPGGTGGLLEIFLQLPYGCDLAGLTFPVMSRLTPIHHGCFHYR